ncbi:MAG: PKD domain-containing protein [Bacteroidales bacterium]|nr:PKD domain-containing protein [Bacteroidales bacterium]
MKSIYNLRFTLPVLLVLISVVSGCKKDEVIDPVTASFSLRPSSVEIGDTVSFINNSLNASFFQWVFGDGGTSIDENPTHVYEEEGNYEPTLVAIGTNDSDTATQSVTVTRSFEVTIYPAVGIEGVDIHDPWSEVQSALTSDTSHYFEYRPDFEVWYHEVYYYTEGIGLIFYSDTSIIHDNYILSFIFLLTPYEGATAEGISIGSTMQKVIQRYGEPENLIEEEGLTGYWYDSQGIDFYSLGTGLVDEIDVYDPADYAKKSTSLHSMTRDIMRQRTKGI